MKAADIQQIITLNTIEHTSNGIDVSGLLSTHLRQILNIA
jgi:hypothetical protein